MNDIPCGIKISRPNHIPRGARIYRGVQNHSSSYEVYEITVACWLRPVKKDSVPVNDPYYHDDVRLRDGEVEYWSKKTKKYVPVKEKHVDSVFFEIKTSTGVEYATEKEFF